MVSSVELNKQANSVWSKVLLRLYLIAMPRESHVFMCIRRQLINAILRQRTKRLHIHPNVFMEGLEGLSFGESVSINRDCNITAQGGVIIGNYVSIGHRSSIISTEHSHVLSDEPIQRQPMRMAPVIIHDNVLLGANVTILAGVEIAEGTVIASGALVTSSVMTPGLIIGGVPAQVLGKRQPA